MNTQSRFLFFYGKRLALAALIVYCAGCSTTHIKKTEVKTSTSVVRSDSMVDIKKLLVLAYGNTSSKIIATNLYSALQDKMKQNGAAASFGFNTQTGDTAFAKTTNQLPAGGYEGYMFLSPLHSASIDFTKQKTGALPVYVGTGFVTRTGYASDFEESYNVQLFDAGNKLLYSGEIKLNMNPKSQFLYKKLIAELITELNKMNIRLW